MQLSLTLIIVILNCVVSIPAFSSEKIMDDLIFRPVDVTYRKQWYRFITSGFIHADFIHLAFNMIALYSFGRYVESGFTQLFGEAFGKGLYGLMYLLALVVSLLPTYLRHKENDRYLSLGASGAVSAVIFAGLIFNPLIGIGILFIPFPIKGYLFGPLYLILSTYLARRGQDHINHSAHIWGALFGVVFIIAAAAAAGYPLLQLFIATIRADIGF